MRYGNKYIQSLFNLIITNENGAWKNGVCLIKLDRFLESTHGNEFIKGNTSLYGKYLEQLKQYPCLFLYEKDTVDHYNLPTMGYLGLIKECFIENDKIVIHYETSDELSKEDILTLQDGLQIGLRGYGFNRTHWAVKNGNIYNIIDSRRPMLENQNIGARPKVFLSYSWEFSETKDKVRKLATVLKDEGIEVIYDETHVRPGQSLNFFMERIDRDNHNKVFIFCDSSYLEKTKFRSGGVGKEAQLLSDYVYNNPEQTKVVPLFVDNNTCLPSFLKGVFALHLSFENWSNDIEDILYDIFR
ncbi:toll/interleukin-1 receptor domain-containing protein [Vagococcus sp. BWB3-3]|uniref:Toll/interleukin-1 receptor domain-containing protein n=1 Tax=Vagococcus allomyrinae TaxID=2794353 RepID=A0A940PAS1_9ENTE|nr:toll/interleukin-1 receptor domain-containing protein [Vagococcus allomyrinae]MBP1044422.1 toll/interleukin-1 receptor domain-containing protein [Vagococcus allomyrinae]